MGWGAFTQVNELRESLLAYCFLAFYLLPFCNIYGKKVNTVFPVVRTVRRKNRWIYGVGEDRRKTVSKRGMQMVSAEEEDDTVEGCGEEQIGRGEGTGGKSERY